MPPTCDFNFECRFGMITQNTELISCSIKKITDWSQTSYDCLIDDLGVYSADEHEICDEFFGNMLKNHASIFSRIYEELAVFDETNLENDDQWKASLQIGKLFALYKVEKTPQKSNILVLS